MKKLIIVALLGMVFGCNEVYTDAEKTKLQTGDTIYVRQAREWCRAVVEKNDTLKRFVVLRRDNFMDADEAFFMTETWRYSELP